MSEHVSPDEATTLLQALEEIVYDATTERPFFGYGCYDEDDNFVSRPPEQPGVEALREVRQALAQAWAEGHGAGQMDEWGLTPNPYGELA